MDDAALARSLRMGIDGALGRIVDRYAPELYEYCLTLLPDAEAAADALCHGLLVAVDKVGRLADPDKFVLWLFALTRNECLRIRQRADKAESAGNTDPLGEVHALTRRHGLDDHGVAAVLGISLHRSRALTARAEALGGWPAYPPGHQLASLPARLRDRVLNDANYAGRTQYRGELAGPLRRSGFPYPLDRPGLARRRMVLVAAAIAAVLTAGTLVTLPFVDGPERFDARDARPDAPVAGEQLPPPVPPLSPRPGRTSGSPSASPSASPKPSAPATKPAAKPPAKPQLPTGAILGIGGGCVEAGGSGADLLRCDGTAEQRWTVGPGGTLSALGRCLDLRDGATADRTRVELDTCDGSTAQQWRTGADGALLNVRSGTCLDGPNNADNPPQLEIWRCTGGPYQRWQLPR